MTKEILKQGGPYKIQKTGPDQHTFSIPMPTDEHGRIARECPDIKCSPGYFKVKTGTGITENQTIAYCPYCHQEAEPDDFTTREQIRYGEDIVLREVEKGMQDMFSSTLGLGVSGKKRIGGDMFSMELSYKPKHLPYIHRPFEEEVLRAVTCPSCGLDHAVFGLAVWCPDCGIDIFMTHVEAEYTDVRTMLNDVDRRRQDLGPRIAARDIENCLEDTVSIFESVLKAILIRFLRRQNETEENIQMLLNRKIRNGFQNPEHAAEIVRNQMKQELFEDIPQDKIEHFKRTFEKRHPITHNLGVIDRKYIERVMAAEQEGKEIRISKQEIIKSIELCLRILTALHARIFLTEGEKQ